MSNHSLVKLFCYYDDFTVFTVSVQEMRLSCAWPSYKCPKEIVEFTGVP